MTPAAARGRAPGMAAILGIDAAWTATEPSGIALLRGDGGVWECVVVAPSYASFVSAAKGTAVDWSRTPTSGRPDVGEILDAARKMLSGASVDLVTIDMPVAMSPITCRRGADDAISRAFGGRGCAVHTPSSKRPGPIADLLRAEFAAHGFSLATTDTPPRSHPALVEVFPHTAVLKLLGASYRVPYKIAKAAKYWPSLPPVQRRTNVLTEWQKILGALGKVIGGVALKLPAAGGPRALKRYEDALDALVCGWVGVEYLAGRAIPYGDGTAAIWTPPC